jgi:hypothetical protein
VFIGLLIFFVLLAVAFFLWVMKSMIGAACPQCLEDGDEEMVIPLLPGFRWFCPACGGAYKNNEVREAGAKVQAQKDDKPEEAE